MNIEVATPIWMDHIKAFLKGEELSERDDLRKMRRKTVGYVLRGDVLYKCGFFLPLLRCLGPDEANYALREIHKGVCVNHAVGRSLVAKLVRKGYYWPTMGRNAWSSLGDVTDAKGSPLQYTNHRAPYVDLGSLALHPVRYRPDWALANWKGQRSRVSCGRTSFAGSAYHMPLYPTMASNSTISSSRTSARDSR